MRGAPTVPTLTPGWFPGPSLGPSWESSRNKWEPLGAHPQLRIPETAGQELPAQPTPWVQVTPTELPPPAPGGLQGQWEEGARPAWQLQ